MLTKSMAAAAVVAVRHKNKSIEDDMVVLEEVMPRFEKCIKQEEISRQVNPG